MSGFGFVSAWALRVKASRLAAMKMFQLLGFMGASSVQVNSGCGSY
jgi:hypothetical protein